MSGPIVCGIVVSNLDGNGRSIQCVPKEHFARLALVRRRRQRLLQLLEQPFVRGIVAEPLLATADQRLVLGNARVIDVVLPT
jgi:hypothetical protein